MTTELLVMGRHLRNRWGGVFEVLTGLLTALDRLAVEQQRSVCLLLPEPGIEPPGMKAVRTVVLPRGSRSRLLWDHRTVPAFANTRDDAVLYNPGIVLPAGLRIPSIVSIHDMLYFPRPELQGRGEYLWADRLYMRRMIARALRRGTAVHVPSEWTRGEVLRLFPGVAPGKIRVFPYGVDVARWNWPQGAEAVRERLRSVGVRPPYFVYAGGLSRRKNVGMLLMAMTAFRKRHPDYRLVITGGEKRTLPEKGLQEALESEVKVGTVIRLGEVPQSELALLYREAAASIYPSLYEGFGLPPLEAQAAGCPVLCSSAASLPEVVGDSALLFDPREIASLIEAMETLSRGASREEWVRKGSDNAARKPWDSIALNLLGLADKIGRSSPQLQM